MFTIVGEKDALMRMLQIANQTIENQNVELAQLRNELHNVNDKLIALRVKNQKPKPEFKLYKWPDFTPHKV